MRKASTLIGLTLVSLAAGARAEEVAPTASPPPGAGIVAPAYGTAPSEQPPRRIEVGLSFLPMGLGKLTTPVGSMEASGDALFAYGGGLSASYRVFAGLAVGLAPQVIYNVNYKVNPSELAPPPAATQYDLLARVAYEFPLADTITPYLELLPGYSIIALPNTSAAKGLVLAVGAGVAMDMTDRIFVNLGIGYQWGFQKVPQTGVELDNKTRYLRVALGGGVRF
jgi:Outer membrane protein beta-barrel domain